MSQEPLVRRESDRGVAVLVLDSPHNRNALSRRLVGELRDGLAAAGGDPGTRAVLLTHTGTTFCAGADLAERNPTGPEELAGLLHAVVALGKPVVGLTTGHVRAGGLGLLAACDVALAGPRATFAFTESRLGLAPALISLTVLPRVDPRAVGRYYLTAEVFDAAEAVRIGLASGTDAQLPAVLDGLRAASPQGLAESKRLATAGVLAGFERDREELVARSTRLFASQEAARGIAAFRERRDPPWTL